jgi:hypothetical protein
VGWSALAEREGAWWHESVRTVHHTSHFVAGAPSRCHGGVRMHGGPSNKQAEARIMTGVACAAARTRTLLLLVRERHREPTIPRKIVWT